MLPKHAVLQRPRGEKRTYGITPRIPGGFITPNIMRKLADVAERYHGTLKITSGQRVVILNLQAEDVEKAWADLEMQPAVLSPYSVKNVEICPASFCKRARQNSMKLAMKIEKRYYGASTPNRTKIAVVGCLNGCASANAKDIAVLANEEGFIVRVGGSAGYHPRLPNQLAENLTDQEAYDLVEAVYTFYCETADMGEKLGPYIDRIGLGLFTEGVFNTLEKLKETSLDE
jgi:NAD(P)H-nitrite reductase large subunit